jgi:hypothetical protein
MAEGGAGSTPQAEAAEERERAASFKLEGARPHIREYTSLQEGLEE